VTVQPGSIVAALAELVAPDLPSRVDTVEYTDPVAAIRDAQWCLTLVCAWRLWRDGALIGVRSSGHNPNDPVFLFTGGYRLDVALETDLDPWTFSLPSMTSVGTMTAG
jgi:hypothetical protein